MLQTFINRVPINCSFVTYERMSFKFHKSLIGSDQRGLIGFFVFVVDGKKPAQTFLAPQKPDRCQKSNYRKIKARMASVSCSSQNFEMCFVDTESWTLVFPLCLIQSVNVPVTGCVLFLRSTLFDRIQYFFCSIHAY